MIYPQSVPTLPWKSCESDGVLITTDGYRDDTGLSYRCYDADNRIKNLPQYSFTMMFLPMQRRMFNVFWRDNIMMGNGLFAAYIDHDGDVRWYVVRFIDPNIHFSKDGEWDVCQIRVEVLGYAITVVDPTCEEILVDDGGDVIVDDIGETIYSDAVSGTASDITWIRSQNG